MSQIDRRLKNVQQADLTESRVNDDFVHWLKTWGNNILLVVLTIAAIAMGWFWWEQKQEQQRSDAWAELNGATLPAALQEVATKHEGKDAVAQFAELQAADRYLSAVVSDQRFDREAGAADAALTPELRTEWLKEADRLYAKVASRVATPKTPGEYGFLFSALFGRAAVAEDMGDLKAAEGYLKDIETRSKGTPFETTGGIATKRIASLQSVASRIELPSKPAPVAPPMAPAIPDLTAPGQPATLTPGGVEGIVVSPTQTPPGAPVLQVTKEPTPADAAPAPKAPAPAPKAP
jgi:hypothetical protein